MLWCYRKFLPLFCLSSSWVDLVIETMFHAPAERPFPFLQTECLLVFYDPAKGTRAYYQLIYIDTMCLLAWVTGKEQINERDAKKNGRAKLWGGSSLAVIFWLESTAPRSAIFEGKFSWSRRRKKRGKTSQKRDRERIPPLVSTWSSSRAVVFSPRRVSHAGWRKAEFVSTKVLTSIRPLALSRRPMNRLCLTKTTNKTLVEVTWHIVHSQSDDTHKVMSSLTGGFRWEKKYKQIWAVTCTGWCVSMSIGPVVRTWIKMKTDQN